MATRKKFPGLQAADFIAFGAYKVEQTDEMQYTKVSKKHTIEDARKAVGYKSPAVKLPITPAVMTEIVTKGIMDVEERRRFWEEGRKTRN